MSVGGVGGGGVEIGESHPLLSSPVRAAEGLMAVMISLKRNRRHRVTKQSIHYDKYGNMHHAEHLGGMPERVFSSR